MNGSERLFNSFTLVLKVLIFKCQQEIKGEKTMATETGETYECEVCGAVVEVKEGGAGELVCCEQPMTLKE